MVEPEIHSHEEIERWKQLRPAIVYVTPEQEAIIKCLAAHKTAAIPELDEVVDALLSTGGYRRY